MDVIGHEAVGIDRYHSVGGETAQDVDRSSRYNWVSEDWTALEDGHCDCEDSLWLLIDS